MSGEKGGSGYGFEIRILTVGDCLGHEFDSFSN